MLSVLTSSATLVSPQINQLYQQTLSNLLQLVLLLASSGIGWAAKMWISHQHNVVTKFVADQAVKYVEQTLGSKSNEEKYAAAAEVMSQRFPKLSQDEVKHLIESSVFDLQSQLQAAVTPPTK